jgi:micrococcal nuclease
LLGPLGLRQLAALAALALAGCSASTVEPEATDRVMRVVDGDTVVLSRNGKTRLIGVDTPEVHGRVECFGPEADRFARRALPPGRVVGVTVGLEQRDRYGRTLAYVFTGGERSFNEMLAERGYARPLTIRPNDDLAPEIAAAAKRARTARRGLWATC